MNRIDNDMERRREMSERPIKNDSGNVQASITTIILNEYLFATTKCSCCREIVFGKIYRVFIEIKFGQLSPPLRNTDVILCQSCAQTINK